MSKVVNELTIGFLIEKLPQVNMVVEQDLLTNVTKMELDSIDLVYKLMIKEIESKGMGNYVILEEIIDLTSLTLNELREQELWKMHFDGEE